MRTLPPPAVSEDQNRSAIVRGASNRRYAAPAERVQSDIAQAFGW
jgi:hypothetical protein